MKTGTSRASARRKSVFMARCRDRGVHSGSDDSTSVAPSCVAEHRLDLLRGRGDDRLLGLRAWRIDHRLADDADAHALRARPARRPCRRVARIGRAQHRRARHGREGIARVVVALDRVLQRVEHLGAVGDRAAVDAAAVAIDVGADGAAVEAEHRLVRQDQRHRVVVGRAAAGGARLLAEARHHQVGADRHAEPELEPSEAERVRVVGIGRIAAPGAALIAERRRQHLVGRVAAARDRRRGRCIRC